MAAVLQMQTSNKVAQYWAFRPIGDRIRWLYAPCVAIDLTVWLALRKHLVMKPAQLHASSTFKLQKTTKRSYQCRMVSQTQLRVSQTRQKRRRHNGLQYVNAIICPHIHVSRAGASLPSSKSIRLICVLSLFPRMALVAFSRNSLNFSSLPSSTPSFTISSVHSTTLTPVHMYQWEPSEYCRHQSVTS